MPRTVRPSFPRSSEFVGESDRHGMLFCGALIFSVGTTLPMDKCGSLSAVTASRNCQEASQGVTRVLLWW